MHVFVTGRMENQSKQDNKSWRNNWTLNLERLCKPRRVCPGVAFQARRFFADNNRIRQPSVFSSLSLFRPAAVAVWHSITASALTPFFPPRQKRKDTKAWQRQLLTSVCSHTDGRERNANGLYLSLAMVPPSDRKKNSFRLWPLF